MNKPTMMSSAEEVVAPVPDRIMELGFGYWGSKTLLSAVELKFFGVLSEAGHWTPTAPRPTRPAPAQRARFLRRAGRARDARPRHDGRYSNTPETDLFLDPAKPTYLGGMLEMLNARLYAFWGSLTEGLRTGSRRAKSRPAATSSRRYMPIPKSLRNSLPR